MTSVERKWVSQLLAVIDQGEVATLADRRESSIGSLSGLIFPLTLIADTLTAFPPRRSTAGDQILQKLKVTIDEIYSRVGFNYFDRKLVPQDIDTAASVTRLLWRSRPDIVSDFDEILRRNTTMDGFYATWDASKAGEWCSGSRAWHVDVILNVCLTQLSLGRRVSVSFLERLVSFGLQNYWYIQQLHTPFLYARVLSAGGFTHIAQLTLPLSKLMNAYTKSPTARLEHSSSCKFPAVQALVRNGQSTRANQCFALAITRILTNNGGTTPPTVSDCDLVAFPIYWTLGFGAYENEHVCAALILQSKWISLHTNTISLSKPERADECV